MKHISLATAMVCLLYTTASYTSDSNAQSCAKAAFKPQYAALTVAGGLIGVISGGILYLSTAQVIKPSWTVFVPGENYGVTICAPNGTMNYNPCCQTFMDENSKLLTTYMSTCVSVGSVALPLAGCLYHKVHTWWKNRPKGIYTLVDAHDAETGSIPMQKL